MRLVLARLGVVASVLGVACGASLAGGCGVDELPSRYTGPRRDAGAGAYGRDAGRVTPLDAWLDPSIDAPGWELLDARDPIEPLDARLDPSIDAPGWELVDAARPDAGARWDGGRLADAGPPGGFDGGTPIGICDIVYRREDPLPSACLPRCSRVTRDTFEACAGEPSCEAFATSVDTTPSVWVAIWWSGRAVAMGCSDCVSSQRYACQRIACPLEVDAWEDCIEDRTPGECWAAQSALARCLDWNRSALSRCESAYVPRCFSSR